MACRNAWFTVFSSALRQTALPQQGQIIKLPNRNNAVSLWRDSALFKLKKRLWNLPDHRFSLILNRKND